MKPIETEEEFDRLRAEIGDLMSAKEGTPEFTRLLELADVVEAWDKAHHALVEPDSTKPPCQITAVIDWVRSELPEATASIDTPAHGAVGRWFVDFTYKYNSVVLDWKNGAQYSISSEIYSCEDDPDFLEDTYENAAHRVLELLLEKD